MAGKVRNFLLEENGYIGGVLERLAERIPAGCDPGTWPVCASGKTSHKQTITVTGSAMRRLEARKFADILKDLANKATSTSSPWANHTVNYLKTHPTSDPDQTKFLAQMLVFQSEAARVISNPRLVGALTDSARQELQHVINGDMSASTIGHVVDLLVADGDRRVKALRDQGNKTRSGIRDTAGGGGGAGKTVDWSELK